ncbi:MAG TPA: GntR family transcriptional regulator, partial [bacterium]|nr:GntR family transcriptional regulator [bacterium]
MVTTSVVRYPALDKQLNIQYNCIMNGQRIGLIRMIENSLRQQIKKGVYPSGSTLPPYRDLARTYNVSLATVQQAVKKLAVDGLLEVYQGRGAVVRGETWLWRPGSINHRVPEQERQIGLFLRSVYQGYNSQTIQDYVQGIADELANWHMSLLLYLHPEDPEEMLSFCLEKIRQRSVVGFILWSLNSRVDREILKTVHRLHLPFVLLNVKEPGALGNKAHYVMADEAAGISQAIDFLFRIG